MTGPSSSVGSWGRRLSSPRRGGEWPSRSCPAQTFFSSATLMGASMRRCWQTPGPAGSSPNPRTGLQRFFTRYCGSPRWRGTPPSRSPPRTTTYRTTRRLWRTSARASTEWRPGRSWSRSSRSRRTDPRRSTGGSSPVSPWRAPAAADLSGPTLLGEAHARPRADAARDWLPVESLRHGRLGCRVLRVDRTHAPRLEPRVPCSPAVPRDALGGDGRSGGLPVALVDGFPGAS